MDFLSLMKARTCAEESHGWMKVSWMERPKNEWNIYRCRTYFEAIKKNKKKISSIDYIFPLASGLISGFHTFHGSKMGLTKIWKYVTWSMRWPTSGTGVSSLPPSLEPQWKTFWGLGWARQIQEISWHGRKISPGSLRWRRHTKWPSGSANRALGNTPPPLKISICGRSYGP